MSDDTRIMTLLQQISLPYQQGIRSTLTHTDPATLRALTDYECHIALRLLDWLDANPFYAHYRDLIKALHPFYDIEDSKSLRFNLWMRADACLWAAPYQVKSSDAIQWQFAIIRLAAFLNTGDWYPATALLLGNKQ